MWDLGQFQKDFQRISGGFPWLKKFLEYIFENCQTLDSGKVQKTAVKKPKKLRNKQRILEEEEQKTVLKEDENHLVKKTQKKILEERKKILREQKTILKKPQTMLKKN